MFVISTLNTGGAQRAFANMSLGLPDGWQADFLLNDAENICYPYHGNVISLGVKPQKDKTKLNYQLKVFVKRYRTLKRLKCSGEYTACISGLASANAINVLTGKKNCETIISFRIFMSKVVSGDGVKGWIKKVSTKWLANRADCVVAVSESMRRDLVQNFGVAQQKAYTIYNGYPLEHIQKMALEPLNEEQKKWFPNSDYIIATVGRLDDQKDHKCLIQAFRKVVDLHANVRLLILGEGPLQKELQELIRKLGLEQKVILCGFQTNPYKIVARSDCFILSSLYEGFPNTLAESLSLGIPAISTDCDSGAREILAPDTEISCKIKDSIEIGEYGILCPVGSCEQMAQAMETILNDSDLQKLYKKKSLERANQLSIDKMMEKWIALIEQHEH